MPRFNVKLFLGLVSAGSLLTGALFGVHRLQAVHIARAFLRKAQRADNEGKPDQLARFLCRYLEFFPDDLAARARLAQTLANDKLTVNDQARYRALFALEQVLVRLPDRHDLRLRLARLAFELERRDLAREHLQRLTESAVNADALLLLGRVAEADSDWEKAVAWYRRAIEHDSQPIEATVRLADILRRRLGPESKEENARQADRLLSDLVARNDGCCGAHLARWRYLMQWGDLEQPEKLNEAALHVDRALELAPTDPDVLLAASDLAQARRQFAGSREFLRKARALHPGDARMYRELALLELHENKLTEAIAALRAGAAVLKGQARFELLWMLANLQLDAKQANEAAATLTEIAKADATPASIDYIQARLHILAGRWFAAVQLLEHNRELFSSTPALARHADFLLAQCYEKLDNAELELAAMNRIVTQDPTSIKGLLGKAAALLALSQLDEAILLYQQIVKLPDAPTTAWLERARLILVRQLRAPAPEWKAVEEALSSAEANNPQALEVKLLRAGALVGQSTQPGTKPAVADNKLQQAQEILDQAKSAHPERAEVWGALAALADRRGDHERAAVSVWEEAYGQIGDSVPLLQMKARFWGRRAPTPEARPALELIAQELQRFRQEERGPVLADLAEGFYRVGAVREAVGCWEQFVQLPGNQGDVRVCLLLFELALLAGNDRTVDQAIALLQRSEGDGGLCWRYATARRQLARARAGDRQGLDLARRLLAAVAAGRPAWPAVHIALADLEVVAGNSDQAIANYRRAIQLGDRSPRLVRKLVQLLYDRQRFDEAEQEVQRLQKQLPASDLQRLAVDVYLQQQDPVRAVQQALAAVAVDSTDFRDHLWLGQVLATSPLHAAQAERHLRRAVELDDRQPETWTALVQLLSQARKPKEALEALDQACRRLPAERSALPLAICHEALGQRDQAEEGYRQALAAHPEDIRAIQGAAAFYLRSDRLALAEPLLRSVIDGKAKASAADVNWARRTLAAALAGAKGRFGDALALVGLSIDSAGQLVEMPVPAEDLADEIRARVRVLARQPRGAIRRQAIDLLEYLGKRQVLSADDRFVLAQLHDSAGNWPRAREELRQLTVQAKDPLHLRYYALALFRRRDLADADRAVGRLEQLEKDRQLETGALGSVELRALLLEHHGQGEQALLLLKEHAGRKQDDPERVFLLMGSLARQKRCSEVLDRCAALQATAAPDRLAGAAVGALRLAGAGAEPCRRVAERIQADLEKDPKSILLRLQLADLEDLRGRYDEAQKRYREVLTLDPDRVVALNNLAWLLSRKPATAAEALPLINRAIELAGPEPELLDTRASVYLALGRAGPAIADLEAANADRPLALRYFHLAQAQKLANNTPAATALLKKATAAGLKADQLHPVERVAFLQMLRELEAR